MFGRDILLVINPQSSKGKGKRKSKNICAYLNSHGRSAVVVNTRDKGHAEEIALKGAKEGFKTIVAVGGDGTVNEVLNGIMHSGLSDQVKMGIIPIGRGNDFAWVCGIPRNIRKASDIIINDVVAKTDVGICVGDGHPDGMYFFNGAGFGFEPLVNFKAMEYRHMNGMPSYICAFFNILKHPPRGYRISLTIDGKERKINSQQISVANGIRMGSAFKMAPNARIDDGKFDVMFTNGIFKGFGLLKMVFKFLKGDHVKDKLGFSYINANEVRILSENDMPVHLDGEVFSKQARMAELRILPGAINLLR